MAALSFLQRAQRIIGLALAASLSGGIANTANGDDLLGFTQLKALDATLTGAGVTVGQAEATATSGGNDWQVTPSAVGVANGFITYASSSGTASTYPNALGTASGHAATVANNFFGSSVGTAKGVAGVVNYQQSYFSNTIITNRVDIGPVKIVNQSFVLFFSDPTSPSKVTSQRLWDTRYDNYIDQYKTIIVSAAGNGDTVNPPSTAYNGISVGTFGYSSSHGPTYDDGRSKPDILGYSSATSYTSPQVSGAAALLIQAANRGDGGSGTATALNDPRTIKSLLLNGATKPAGWSHTSTAPLDTLYGSGLMNILRSYRLLQAGQQTFSTSNTYPTGQESAPPPGLSYAASLRGWDFSTVSSSASADAVNHYAFSVSDSAASVFELTGTLTWHRQYGKSSINNLDLLLYNVDTGALVTSSISTVDNVEHLYLPGLTPGNYDLQVVKRGGSFVTAAETYALAFDFAPYDSTWNLNANGNWSTGPNWNGPIPSVSSAIARFANLNTAPRTITLDAAQTLGTLEFDSTYTYTLAGSNTLTLNDSATARIRVLSGNQIISAPLAAAQNTTIAVNGGSLTLSGTLTTASGKTLSKNGTGTLTISGTQDHAASTVLNVNAGTLNLNSNAGPSGARLTVNVAAALNLNATQDLSALNVSDGGTTTVNANGTRALATSAINITGGGILDLNDNALIVRGGNRSTVAGYIASARGAGVVPAWNGPGITSGTARSVAEQSIDAFTVAAIRNGDLASIAGRSAYTTFLGFSVGSNDVLVRGTWMGDADLSGAIDATDYTLLNGGYNLGWTPSWISGDFNLDNVVDASDYLLIDSGYAYQQFGPPLGALLVPEPAATGLLLSTLIAALRPRQRRHACRPTADAHVLP